MLGVVCIKNITIAPGLGWTPVLLVFLWAKQDEVTASGMEAAP
jgi:hypothetical protein